MDHADVGADSLYYQYRAFTYAGCGTLCVIRGGIRTRTRADTATAEAESLARISGILPLTRLYFKTLVRQDTSS